MLAAVILLALCSAVFLAGVCYLLVERGRLRSDIEVAAAHLQEAERRTVDFERETREARSALDAAAKAAQENSQRLADAMVQAATLKERSEAMELQSARYAREFKERVADMQNQFRATIDASAAQALKQSSDQFLKLAEKTFAESSARSNAAIDAQVKPLAETLKKTDEKLALLEKSRLEAYASLTQQIRTMAESGNLLREETGNLVNALRKPQVRGRYGEIQLERVAELAGMRDYCDFSTQSSSRDSEGRLLRPDMVVRMPNGRALAIDAKTNIEAYLDAIEAGTPEESARQLDRFARHVSDQAEALAKKEYWTSTQDCFDFVVMFIPGDQFIDAALERRPQLLELAAQRGIILASPSTLIGLLRAVYLGWREKSLSDNARELFELGKELHERASTALGYAAEVGRSIGQAQEKYNRFVGSVEGRLMPTLRRFEERGAMSGKALPDLDRVDGTTRALRSLPDPSDSQEAQKNADDDDGVIRMIVSELDQPTLLD